MKRERRKKDRIKKKVSTKKKRRKKETDDCCQSLRKCFLLHSLDDISKTSSIGLICIVLIVVMFRQKKIKHDLSTD